MENDLLRWFRAELAGHQQLVVGVGDDAAVIKLSDGMQLVATTDMLMDGVDFRLGLDSPVEIGHKAIAVNLSDLAAMAARPVAALVSLCLPQAGGEVLAKNLYCGIRPIAAQYHMAIAGGDTNSWSGPLVINVTALGEVEPGRAWRRSGARAGDLILVTGRFGGSILEKHLTFQPRVWDALWLADHLDVHAAIDVSDGLSLDLVRLAEASGVGACINLDRIPIAEAAERLSRQRADGVTPRDHALSDGEDFELILAADRTEFAELLHDEPRWKKDLTPIGHFVERPGLWIGQGEDMAPLAPRGWEHRLDP